jgi:hypothetical protein
VKASLGLGLDEIFSLDSFLVESMESMASRFVEAGLDLESLVEAARKGVNSTDSSVRTDLVYSPVIFLFYKPTHFLMANYLKIPRTSAKRRVPTHKCYRQASDYFKELQRVPMPDLNE